MVDDPYKVLGIQHGVAEAEIKKAYRKKAKEYHPDLHPDDPNATKKMNEVNEAYDMLMNPEKYANQRAQQQRSSQQQQYNPYHSQNSGSYRGSGGWSSDFGGFGFEDIFGFGFSDSGSQNASRPTVESGDSPTIQRVIQAINSRQYQAAVDMLTNVTSSGRDARWYYLSALANHGLGNTVQAMDHIQRAIKMDSNNRTYQQLYRQYRQAEQTYETNAQGFDMGAMQMQKVCIFDLDSECGKMFREPSPAEIRKGRTSGSSSKNSSELVSIPFMSLDLTPGAGNLLDEFYWEILSPWRGESLILNTGPAHRSGAAGSTLWSILEAHPHPRYFLTRKACLGILRRASERGKPLPEQLRIALEIQSGVRNPDEKGSQNIACKPQYSYSKAAFGASSSSNGMLLSSKR